MEERLNNQLEEETELLVKPPKKYKVIMHNDDYSTWEFVIEVLKKVFHKNEESAVEITSSIHEKGNATCGIYGYEIAEMKTSQVHSLAKANGFPLKCTIEEE